MARSKKILPENLPATLKLGGVTIYSRKGSKNLVARTAGGPSKEKIETDAAFAAMRFHQSEFSCASSAAKTVCEALISLKPLSDFQLHSRMSGLLRAIMLEETTALGKTPLIFSNAKHLMDGFQLNDQDNFDSVITTPITFSLDRETQTAVLQLPPLSPGKNFKNKWAEPYFRFRITLGILRDMAYVEDLGYTQITKDVRGYTEMLDTEWYPSRVAIIGQEVGLKIINPVFDETCSLILGIGIQFGSPVYGKMKPTKNTGCAKILSIA